MLPLHRALDTGLRPAAFTGRAASLLLGIPAATRTGLPPASDDEPTTEINYTVHLQSGCTKTEASEGKPLHAEGALCFAHVDAGRAAQHGGR